MEYGSRSSLGKTNLCVGLVWGLSGGRLPDVASFTLVQLHLDNLMSPFLPATNPAGMFWSGPHWSYPGPWGIPLAKANSNRGGSFGTLSYSWRRWDVHLGPRGFSQGTGTATSASRPSIETRTKPEPQLSHCHHSRTGLKRFVRAKCFVMKLYFYSPRLRQLPLTWRMRLSNALINSVCCFSDETQ